MKRELIIRDLATTPYSITWQAMREFTTQRDESTLDELWLLEHFPIFTQGQAGKPEHILDPHQIPVMQTDRGGQVTYHGPGQLMVYTLFDIQRLGLSIRNFVIKLEQIVIDLLASHQIQALAQRDAPGVYVNNAKICSIGLRVRHGRSYHGIALNVDMDLTPFSYINPCGYRGLQMTQIAALITNPNSPNLLGLVKQQIIAYFAQNFGYTPRL